MPSIIDSFIHRNLISKKDVDRILEAKISNEPLHQLVIRSGLVSEEDYIEVMSQEMALPKLEDLPSSYDPGRFIRISPLFMD